MQNQSFPKHHVVPITSLLGASKYPTELAVGQIGIFDSDTNMSVTSPLFPTNKAIYFGYRLPQGTMADMNRPNAHPFYSAGIKASNIEDWRGYRGHRGKTEIVAIGYDGIDTTKDLSCIVGTSKDLFILLDGSPITKLHGPQGLMLRYNFTSCFVGTAGDSCTDAVKREQMNNIVNQINNDKSHFGFIEASPNEYATSPASWTTVAWNTYQLTIADGGGELDLALVQSKYSTAAVRRISRDGVNTTYEIYALSTPAAFSTGYIAAIPNCTTCPTGYTSRASHTYTFSKIDAGDATALTAMNGLFNINENEVLGETIIRTGYSMGISTYLVVSDYPFTAAGATVSEIQSLSASGASAGTFTLTFDGETTTAIAYNANAATILAALNALPNIASGDVAVVNAGTAASTATTFTFSGTAYTGQNVPQIVVNITGLTGASGGVMSTSTPGTLDTTGLQGFTYLGLLSTTCILETPTSVSWSLTGTAKQYQKSYFLTLADTECGADRLVELQSAYNGVGTVSIESTGTCVHKYKLVTVSNIVAIACFPDEAVFPIVNPYQESNWVDQGLVGTAGTGGLKFGIIIKAAAFNRYSSECAFGDFTDDFDGIHIRVSEYELDWNGTPAACNTTWPITKLQNFAPPTNTGAQIRLKEESTYADVLQHWSDNAGIRQAEGYKLLADPDKIYDTYTLKYKVTYQVGMFSERYSDFYSEHFHFIAGQGKAFETAMNAFVLSSGKSLAPVIL